MSIRFAGSLAFPWASEARDVDKVASTCASSVVSCSTYVTGIETALAWKAKFMAARAAVKKRVVRIVVCM